MSRAFVKEVDDAPLLPPLERPVSAAPNLVTPRGARLIERAIAVLEEQIAAAIDEKDLSSLRRDLRYWLSRRSNMQIIPILFAAAAAASLAAAIPAYANENTENRGGIDIGPLGQCFDARAFQEAGPQRCSDGGSAAPKPRGRNVFWRAGAKHEIVKPWQFA
jgi:hypothetical protein